MRPSRQLWTQSPFFHRLPPFQLKLQIVLIPQFSPLRFEARPATYAKLSGAKRSAGKAWKSDWASCHRRTLCQASGLPKHPENRWAGCCSAGDLAYFNVWRLGTSCCLSGFQRPQKYEAVGSGWLPAMSPAKQHGLRLLKWGEDLPNKEVAAPACSATNFTPLRHSKLHWWSRCSKSSPDRNWPRHLYYFSYYPSSIRMEKSFFQVFGQKKGVENCSLQLPVIQDPQGRSPCVRMATGCQGIGTAHNARFQASFLHFKNMSKKSAHNITNSLIAYNM